MKCALDVKGKRSGFHRLSNKNEHACGFPQEIEKGQQSFQHGKTGFVEQQFFNGPVKADEFFHFR